MDVNYLDLMTKVNQLTATDPKERLSLLRYAANHLNDYLVVKAVKEGDEFFYQKKAEHRNVGRSVLIFSGLIIALKKYRYADQKARHRKCSEEHIVSMEDLHEGRRVAAIRRRSKSSKKNLLLEHLPDLIRFQREGFSLRDMVEYLKLKDINVSRETIRRILNDN